jgi:hypothetical protein
LRVKVLSDADPVSEDGGVNIVASVDVDAPHELDEMARFGLAVGSDLVYGFADEMECHATFPYFRYD